MKQQRVMHGSSGPPGRTHKSPPLSHDYEKAICLWIVWLWSSYLIYLAFPLVLFEPNVKILIPIIRAIITSAICKKKIKNNVWKQLDKSRWGERSVHWEQLAVKYGGNVTPDKYITIKPIISFYLAVILSSMQKIQHCPRSPKNTKQRHTDTLPPAGIFNNMHLDSQKRYLLHRCCTSRLRGRSACDSVCLESVCVCVI